MKSYNCDYIFVRKSGYSIPAFIFKFRRCCIIKELQINEEIREKEVRLIDTDGSQLGVVPIRKALEIANDRRLDLVNVAPNAKPAVCRIMDYGNMRWQKRRKKQEKIKK